MQFTSFAQAPVPGMEADYATKPNAELRAIIAEDAALCQPHQCYCTREGYTAKVILNARRTWGTLAKFD